MRKSSTIYLFISILIFSLIFNINLFWLFIYGFTLFISIASNTIYAFAFFTPSIAFTKQPLLMFSYAIAGVILFIIPLMQKGILKETISKHFLQYTAPFYIVISSGFLLYSNDRFSTMVYCLLLLFMFLSRSLIGFIIFGLGTLLLNSINLTIAYLFGYTFIYINNKLTTKHIISESNVYIQSEDFLQTDDKTKDLNHLITELSIIRDDIVDVSIENNVRELITLCEKIKSHTDKHNVHKINKLINYYAPELITILKDYTSIEKVGVVSEENLMFKVNVMRILDTSTEAFKKILQSMLDNTIKKSNIDMQVLEQMLKDENLL